MPLLHVPDLVKRIDCVRVEDCDVRIHRKSVLQRQRIRERRQQALADSKGRLAHKLAVNIRVDRGIVEETVAGAENPVRRCLRFPGYSDTRAEIVLVGKEKRARKATAVRTFLVGKYLRHLAEPRVAKAQVQGEIRPDLPVILNEDVEALVAQIGVAAAEAPGRRVRKPQQEIREIVSGSCDGPPFRVEGAAGKSRVVEGPPRVRIHAVVALVPAEISAHADAVFVADFVQSACQRNRLVAADGRGGELQVAVIGEGDVRDAKIDRISRDALDAQFSLNVLDKGKRIRALGLHVAQDRAVVHDEPRAKAVNAAGGDTLRSVRPVRVESRIGLAGNRIAGAQVVVQEYIVLG